MCGGLPTQELLCLSPPAKRCPSGIPRHGLGHRLLGNASRTPQAGLALCHDQVRGWDKLLLVKPDNGFRRRVAG